MFVCRWIYSTNDANEYTWLMFVCGFIFYLPNKIQLCNNCISMLGPGLLTNLGLHDVKDEVEGPVNHQFRPMNCFHIVHGSLNCTIFWGINQCKRMVILKDFTCTGTLFGLVK